VTRTINERWQWFSEARISWVPEEDLVDEPGVFRGLGLSALSLGMGNTVRFCLGSCRGPGE